MDLLLPHDNHGCVKSNTSWIITKKESIVVIIVIIITTGRRMNSPTAPRYPPLPTVSFPSNRPGTLTNPETVGFCAPLEGVSTSDLFLAARAWAAVQQAKRYEVLERGEKTQGTQRKDRQMRQVDVGLWMLKMATKQTPVGLGSFVQITWFRKKGFWKKWGCKPSSDKDDKKHCFPIRCDLFSWVTQVLWWCPPCLPMRSVPCGGRLPLLVPFSWQGWPSHGSLWQPRLKRLVAPWW